MNNRYLYRAKRTDNGEFIEGLLTIMWGQFHIINPDDENTAYPIDESTICQCTGLRDKNGKLIWENDKCVVRKPCVLAYGTIKYLDGCFCFVEDTGNILRLCDIRINGFEIKIESNIFDNPKLLELLK